MLIVANYHGYQATVVLDNVHLNGKIGTAVTDASEKVILEGGSKAIVSWGLGRRYTKDDMSGSIWVGDMAPPRKDPNLLEGNRFFEKSKPQYHQAVAPDFLNVLDFGARNDGIYPNDNAKRINQALSEAAGKNKILVFPAGIYKVDNTLFIPPGSRLVGFLWSQIVAIGLAFGSDQELKVLAK